MLEEDIPPPKVTKKVIREYRNILEAIKAKDMAALEDYFRQGGSLNARIEGTTLLITAVKTGNVEMVKWLIENGANTEKTDSDGRSPYLYAQIANNEVILSLIGDNAASSGSEISHWQHQGDNWSRGR
jgi:ankyrin repeat protein